ncbi:MAG TPA: ABC transporter substrate-binding protein [Gammaproteobacteria bacterium]|nr:ABC transporter substrate-binding protein [Gammaproteobacteria bacterium]
MLKRILATVGALMLFVSPAVFAQTDSPVSILENATNEALRELNRNHGEIRKDINKLYDLVDRLVFPLVDFEAMSKLVLGKHWKKATPEQRQRFMDAFAKMLKYTYTRSLRDYTDQEIRYFPNKTQIKGRYASVYSEFVPGGGKPNVPVVYKLRKSKDGKWKAYNLIIDNLSMVKNYRTDFSREIREKGLDSLIDRLEKEQEEQKRLAEAGKDR